MKSDNKRIEKSNSSTDFTARYNLLKANDVSENVETKYKYVFEKRKIKSFCNGALYSVFVQ